MQLRCMQHTTIVHLSWHAAAVYATHHYSASQFTASPIVRKTAGDGFQSNTHKIAQDLYPHICSEVVDITQRKHKYIIVVVSKLKI